MQKVSLIQYVHPHGNRNETSVELPDDVAVMASRQVLSCECAPNNYSQIIFYSYPKGSDPDENPEVEEILFAENGPGEKGTVATLERLIRMVDAKISAQAVEAA